VLVVGLVAAVLFVGATRPLSSHEHDGARHRGEYRPNWGVVLPHEVHIPEPLSQDEIHRRFHLPPAEWSWANKATPEPKRKKLRAEPSRVMANIVHREKEREPKEEPTVRANIVHHEKERETEQQLVRANLLHREKDPKEPERERVPANIVAHEKEPKRRIKRDLVPADVVHSEPKRKHKKHKAPGLVADAHVSWDEPKAKAKRKPRAPKFVADAHASWDEPKAKAKRKPRAPKFVANAHASWDERVPRRHHRRPAPFLVAADRSFADASYGEGDGDGDGDDVDDESRDDARRKREPELVSADVNLFPKQRK